MKTNRLPLFAATAVVLLIMAAGCNTPAKQTGTATADTLVTNPLFKIAPAEYATLAEQSVLHVAAADFDAWGAMLADDVEYDFPDGDPDTRTKLMGKTAVLDWWKNYRKTPGVGTMTMTEFNHTPIEVTGNPKGGAKKGIVVLSYFTSTQVIKGQSVGVRMNFATYFNADKKIDRYTTYYDRTPIVKALGRNMLAEGKATK
ncbi:MAG: hypothetical protein LH606_02820 [Cytophagaceae bacterium]|nr:hypothetical protein [Cytophagaceae bacterium]